MAEGARCTEGHALYYYSIIIWIKRRISRPFCYALTRGCVDVVSGTIMLITHAVPLFRVRLIFHDPLTAVTKLLNPVRWYPRTAISPYDVYDGNSM